MSTLIVYMPKWCMFEEPLMWKYFLSLVCCISDVEQDDIFKLQWILGTPFQEDKLSKKSHLSKYFTDYTTLIEIGPRWGIRRKFCFAVFNIIEYNKTLLQYPSIVLSPHFSPQYFKSCKVYIFSLYMYVFLKMQIPL